MQQKQKKTKISLNRIKENINLKKPVLSTMKTCKIEKIEKNNRL